MRDLTARRGAADLLCLDGFSVVDTSSSLEAVCSLAELILDDTRPGRPDCLVIDADRPTTSGLALVAGLRSLGWTMPVTFVLYCADPAALELATSLTPSRVLYPPAAAGDVRNAVHSLVPPVMGPRPANLDARRDHRDDDWDRVELRRAR